MCNGLFHSTFWALLLGSFFVNLQVDHWNLQTRCTLFPFCGLDSGHVFSARANPAVFGLGFGCCILKAKRIDKRQRPCGIAGRVEIISGSTVQTCRNCFPFFPFLFSRLPHFWGSFSEPPATAGRPIWFQNPKQPCFCFPGRLRHGDHQRCTHRGRLLQATESL